MLAMDINTLEDCVLHLDSRSQEFARSLIRSYRRYGSLTEGQRPYVAQLINRASCTGQTSTQPVGASRVAVGNFAAVISLFATARQHLKYPKVRLLCDGTPIILSVAGERSSAPGTVSVCGEGQYPNRAWYGRVTPYGEWEPARNVSPAMLESLAVLLSSFARDPHSMAAAYGRATNSCCFCQRELTDPRSVTAGYGPVCAEHYGLKYHWLASVSVETSKPTLTPAPALQTDLWGVL